MNLDTPCNHGDMSLKQRSDEELYELLRGGRDGAHAAFEEFYSRHSARVYTYCQRMMANEPLAEDLFPGDLGMTVGGACLACPYIGCSSESISMNTRVAAPDDQPTTSRLAMPVARCVQLAARIARYYRATADPVELAQRCTGPNRQTTGLGCGRLRPPAWWWSIS